jgi:hypothetical protein
LNLTAVDLTGLDALGYGGSNLGNSNAAPTTVAFRLVEVPEPGSLLLLLTGLMATLAAGAPLFRHRLFAEMRSRPQSAAAAV